MTRRRLAITAPRLAITGRRPDISGTSASPIAIATFELAATEPLGRALPPRRWRPWAWAAAILMHVAVILALLLLAREQPQQEQSPPGVSVVFENGGGAPQAASPPEQRPGPPSPAQTPPPAASPPPQTAQAEPEVNLNMPLAEIQNAPEPQPPAPPQPRPVERPKPPQKYVVMNDMSYGNTSSQPVPNARRGLNLSLAQTDVQAVNAPELRIKGDAGTDWNAKFRKWVNDHLYYPEAALEQNQQGDVEVEFTVDRAGHVTGVHLLGSSGSPFLDQAWFRLFADNQMPAFARGSKSNTITIDASVHYQITN